MSQKLSKCYKIITPRILAIYQESKASICFLDTSRYGSLTANPNILSNLLHDFTIRNTSELKIIASYDTYCYKLRKVGGETNVGLITDIHTFLKENCFHVL